MAKQVILIDGKNLAYRHGWTQRNLRYNNVPTGMLYGAITGIARLARFYPDAVIAFCWDGAKAHESWRHKLCPDYKSNRKLIKPKTKQDKDKHAWKEAMNIQIPLFKQWIDLMGFKQLEVATLEADDLIGILSAHLKPMADKVFIYSGDRDFYQLMSKRVKVIHDRDKTKKCKPLRSREIIREYGVSPKQWLKYRGLVGDKGDKIDNVKGIGPKTALKLLAAGVDARKYLKKHPSIKSQKDWELITLNYNLSKIITNIHKLGSPIVGDSYVQVSDFLKGIKSLSDVARKKDKKDYKKMELFLARYGFDSLMVRRKELWNLR